MSGGFPIRRRNGRDAGDWQFLRVYYFDECKDDLILKGIWPAITARTITRHSAYFQRDWEGGPNVLVGIRYKDTSVPDIVHDINAYLRRHPSMASLSEVEFAAWAAQVATSEARSQIPLMRMQANNSVLTDAHEFSNHVLKHSPALKSAIRNFLCRSSELVVNWLTANRKGSKGKSFIAIRLLIALIWSVEPQRLRAHMSLGSHIQGFFYGQRGDLREAFARHYSRRQKGMVELLSAFVKRLANGSAEPPGMMEYVKLLRWTFADLVAGFREGRYATARGADVVKAASRYVNDTERKGTIRVPPVAEAVIALRDGSVLLQAWQVLVNLTYLALKQLGLTPLERFLACYLVTRAVEDVFGEPAVDLMSQLKRTGDPRLIISLPDLNEAIPNISSRGHSKPVHT